MEEQRFQEEIRAFGLRLRKLRTERDLTQLALEVRCHIDRTEISRIENGENNIEFFTIVKLAVALNIELNEFFKPDEQTD